MQPQIGIEIGNRLLAITDAIMGGGQIEIGFGSWHHPDLVNGELPSGSETFQMIAEVVVSGDATRYRPTKQPNILVIDSAKMAADGYKFRLSENGVWLTDHVPPGYIRVG